MRLRRWNRATWAAPVLAALAVCGQPQPRCHGQQAPAAAPAGWTSPAQALQATARLGTPTVVVVTSRSSPASQALCEALSQSPEARAAAGSVLFAEMPAEVYASQVKALRITRFPSFVVYQRVRSGVEAVGLRNDLTDGREVYAWLGTLGIGVSAANAAAAAAPVNPPVATGARLASVAPADSSVAQSQYQQYPSGQVGSPAEQHAPLPLPPAKQPPAMPPAYNPPAYNPPPQQPVYAQPPPQYVPAPAPVYVQTQTPAMIVQQAPQQIILAPPSPPQVTVAMAAPMAYALAPLNAPAPNLFTQPVQALPSQPVMMPSQPPPMMMPSQPPPMMMASQPPPMMMASQPPPMMMASQPQPTQAPQQVVMQAPQQFAQAPAPVMMLQAPGLLNSLLGTVGEHLARLRNPRVQMSPMPTLAQAPMANAPLALVPAGYGQAPAGYAPMMGYAPAGPPMALVTPESTSFAPCNTYGAPCKYHGGPCPGPGGGGYAPPPPPPPYPSASPQGGYAPRTAQGSGSGWLDWLHHRN